MSRLPSGMYYPGDSVIYRLDSLIKFIAFIILLVAIVCTDTLIGYCILIAMTIGLIVVSKISFRTALDSVRRLYLFFIIILVMNICFFSPDQAWFSLWLLTPSYNGLIQGFHVVFRLILILTISNVLLTTTSPMEITDAMQRLIYPLHYVRIPADQIALIFSVAIQFIPTLFEETDMIWKAQTARGARFDSPKWREKAKAVVPLIVPIFLAAFKRADELSLAMEARGYRTGTTRMEGKRKRLGIGDFVAVTVVTILAVVLIVWL